MNSHFPANFPTCKCCCFPFGKRKLPVLQSVLATQFRCRISQRWKNAISTSIFKSDRNWLFLIAMNKIDHKQFGVIQLCASWICFTKAVKFGYASLRICFLDFSKAFDRINLITFWLPSWSFYECELLRSLLSWICSFLSNRKQRVKLGKSLSEWVTANAGVPQGTRLGLILFLVMINDLVLPTCYYWKYVDDLTQVTASEVIAKYGNSTIQSDLDYISSWSSANYMKLNAKKCKELRVCFFRDTPVLEPY